MLVARAARNPPLPLPIARTDVGKFGAQEAHFSRLEGQKCPARGAEILSAVPSMPPSVCKDPDLPVQVWSPPGLPVAGTVAIQRVTP